MFDGNRNIGHAHHIHHVQYDSTLFGDTFYYEAHILCATICAAYNTSVSVRASDNGQHGERALERKIHANETRRIQNTKQTNQPKNSILSFSFSVFIFETSFSLACTHTLPKPLHGLSSAHIELKLEISISLMSLFCDRIAKNRRH